MLALCIDTATEYGAVALGRSGELLASAVWRSSARHGENLFGHIDSVLLDAGVTRTDLTLVGASTGPGKFTSLRVGLAAAKGIALALDLPIVGVGSLPVLARTADRSEAEVIVALMNAYRGDLFGAAYRFELDEVEELVAPRFGSPAELLGPIRDTVGARPVGFCGEGVHTHLEALRGFFGLDDASVARVPVAPSPGALVAEVGHSFRTQGPRDLATLEPRYLRPSDAKLPANPLMTSG